MKKILCHSIVVITSFVINGAQSFQGKAIYKTHRKVDMKIGGGPNSTMSDAQKAQFEAMMKKQFQKNIYFNF